MEEDKKILEAYIKAIDTFGTIDYKCINNLYKPVKNILNELERLQLINQSLEKTKDTCPEMATSSIRCSLKNALNFEKTVHTCLHCGEETPLYCEKCHQDLIGRNAKLQTELQRQYNTGYLAGIMHADLDWKDLIKDEIKDYKRMRGASNFFNSEISILEKLLKKGE